MAKGPDHRSEWPSHWGVPALSLERRGAPMVASMPGVGGTASPSRPYRARKGGGPRRATAMNLTLTRRSFLKVGLAGGAALFLPWRAGTRSVRAAEPAGLLDPGEISHFMTPLLIPPAMPRAGKIRADRGKQIDYYDLAVRQFQQ